MKVVVEVSERVLDNPVWHALTGPRRELGTVLGGAARFDTDVAPFGALREDAGASDWADLAALVGVDGITCVLEPGGVPEGWRVEVVVPCVQMIATRPLERDERGFEPLGSDDVEEMLALIAETRPGPFAARTVAFGGFIGLREGGTLVAMAGERVRCPGFTEVSGVCTSPAHRGRGLGGALTRMVGHRIQQRGESAFLHAAVENTNAIRLYESLGFVVRRAIAFTVLRAPGES